MKKLLFGLIAPSLMAMSLIACKQQEGNTSVDSSIEESAESGITAIATMADDASGSSFALKPKTFMEKFASELSSYAYASSCVRPVYSGCNSGVKSQTYSACQLGSSPYLMSGDVDLTYSNGACALSNDGDSVNRTYDVQIDGPRGGLLEISSASHNNYLGETLGGGGQLTKTSGGWEIDIAGKHKVLTANSRQLFDISVHTTNPLNVYNTLSRNGRVIDGGTFKVDHNRAKFSAAYSPSNLTWQSSCCYPTSGSISVSYTGSVSGSGSVNFLECGVAQLNYNGKSRIVQLSYCE